MLVALVACSSPGAEGVSRWTGRVDTLDGRVVVRNPAEALLSADRFEVRELWSRPLGWGAGSRRVWEPGPAVRSLDGELFLLDFGGSRVEVRSAEDGSFLRTLGEGDGHRPGELSWPRSLAVSGEVVGVADSSEIEFFAPTGEPLRRVPVADRTLELYGLGGGAFLSFEFSAGGARWRFYASPEAEGEPYPPPITRSESFPEAAQSECWNVEGVRDGLLLLSCAHPVLLRFRRDGGIRREVALGGGPVEPSAEEREALRRNTRARVAARRPHLDGEVVERIVEREVRRHRLEKRFRGARRDSSTGLVAVLEQTPEYMGGSGANVLLLTDEGVLLGRLEFDRHWLDMEFQRGRLYAVAQEPGSGDPVLAAYELRVPPSVGDRYPGR